MRETFYICLKFTLVNCLSAEKRKRNLLIKAEGRRLTVFACLPVDQSKQEDALLSISSNPLEERKSQSRIFELEHGIRPSTPATQSWHGSAIFLKSKRKTRAWYTYVSMSNESGGALAYWRSQFKWRRQRRICNKNIFPYFRPIIKVAILMMTCTSTTRTRSLIAQKVEVKKSGRDRTGINNGYRRIFLLFVRLFLPAILVALK